MKRYIVILISTLITTYSYSQIQNFFRPIPPPAALPPVGGAQVEWHFRPMVSLPAMKLVESSRSDSKVDALLLTSTGGGVSIQRMTFDPTAGNNGKWKCSFSWSPITVLLSGNLSSDNPVDVAGASTLGFFNNLIMLGAGYDLGKVTGRSRVFGLMSIGINLNN